MIDSIRQRMSTIGFGGSGIGNLYQPISDAAAHATIGAAITNGIRYLDTAPHYGFGLSEKRLGNSLRELDPSNDVVLSTKVGRSLVPVSNVRADVLRQGFASPEPFESAFDYSYDAVMRSIDESLRRLQRPIDILYVHDLGRRTHGEAHAEVMKQFLEGGYVAIRKARDEGVVRAIGLGANEWEVCEEALAHADFDMVLLAGRYTLLEQTALDSFMPLCRTRKVAVVVGAPFNSGILVRGVSDASATYDYGRVPASVLEKVAAIEAVCGRHDVSMPAAALQFPLAHPQVVSVIPGMSTPREVAQAIAWQKMKIPTDFWDDLREHGLLGSDAPVPGSL
jgi:D-threo-aldose 1-dehydrogenase